MTDSLFNFDALLMMIDEEGLFEDRGLYDSGKNAVSLECEKIKTAAIEKGMTEDDIKELEWAIHNEVDESVEIIELSYQLTAEVLLTQLSRKLDIPSDIGEYLGSAFDQALVPLVRDYKG